MSRGWILVASLIGALGGLANAQQPPAPQAPAGPPKIAVLIVTGQHGHNWKGTTPLLRKILEDTGGSTFAWLRNSAARDRKRSRHTTSWC